MKAPASSFIFLAAAVLITGLPSALIAGEELVLEEEAAPSKSAQPTTVSEPAAGPAATAPASSDEPVLEVEGEAAAPAAPAKPEAPDTAAAEAKPAGEAPAKAEPQKADGIEEALLEVEPANTEPAITEPTKEEPAVAEGASAEAPAAEAPAAEAPAAETPAAEAPKAAEEQAAGDGSGDELTLEEETPAPAEPAAEGAAETQPADAPADEAIAVEEPAPKEVPPEPVKVEAPKPVPVPVPAAVKEEAPTPEAVTEGDEPSLDEEVGAAEEAPGDTAGKESEVTVDEPQDEAAAPEAEALKAPLAGIKIAGVPAAEAPPSFKIPGKERGFQEFLACGVPVSAASSCQVSSVTGSPDADRYLSFRGTEVALTGKLKRGQVLAAYRTEQGSCLARYLGIVVVTGDGPRSAGAQPASRGYVANSREPIVPGDALCAYETVQKEYERQYAKEPRAGAGPVQGTIACIANGLLYLDTRQRTVLVDRGKKDGISPGWSCEFQAPGAGGRTTYGRVIRADEATCFVQFMRLCEPVETGRQVVLSGARTKAASPSKRR